MYKIFDKEREIINIICLDTAKDKGVEPMYIFSKQLRKKYMLLKEADYCIMVILLIFEEIYTDREFKRLKRALLLDFGKIPKKYIENKDVKTYLENEAFRKWFDTKRFYFLMKGVNIPDLASKTAKFKKERGF